MRLLKITLLYLFLFLASAGVSFAQATQTYTLIDNLNWKKGMVAATSVTESYSYDPVADVVTINYRFNTPGFAPLPPMLALAKKYGFPLQVNKPVVDTGQSSDIGPLLGVSNTDNYAVQITGLSKYALSSRALGSGTVPTPLQQDLNNEVDKIVAAGHLAPTLFGVSIPGSGTDPRGQAYWYNPGDALYFLSEVYPLLDSSRQQAVRAYLQQERTNYPPEDIRGLAYWQGTSRFVHNATDQVLGYWWFSEPNQATAWRSDIYFRVASGAKIRNLYGLARYYVLLNIIPTSTVMGKINNIVSSEMNYSDWATLYWQFGHWPEYNAVHAVNQLFSGLIGYVWLARIARDKNAEDLGWGLLSKMAILRFAMGKYTQFQYDTGRFTFPQNNPRWLADQHVANIQSGKWGGELITFNFTKSVDNTRQIHRLDDQGVWVNDWFGNGAGANTSVGQWFADGQLKHNDLYANGWDNVAWASMKSPYLLPFADLTPELGRFLKDYLQPEVRVFSNRIIENQPHWYMAYAESLLGFENGYMAPTDSYGHFLATAWVLGESPQQLERYVDYPFLRVGDYFYLHKLAETAKTYRGITWSAIALPNPPGLSPRVFLPMVKR